LFGLIGYGDGLHLAALPDTGQGRQVELIDFPAAIVTGHGTVHVAHSVHACRIPACLPGLDGIVSNTVPVAFRAAHTQATSVVRDGE